MKGIFIILGVIFMLFLIGASLDLLGLGWFGFIGPKRAAVEREVFKQTKSYNEAKLQDLVKYRLEYLQEDDPLKNLEKVKIEEVEKLESIADEISEELPLLTNFVIPGGTPSSAFLHVSRTVCRRAERRIVYFANIHPVNEELVKYINRLSDLLFVLARYENHLDHGDVTISREGIKD